MNRDSGEKGIQRPSNYLRALTRFYLCRRASRVLELTLAFAGLLGASGLPAFGQSPVLTLDEAIRAAEKNNRSVRVAALQRKTAADEVRIARTFRLPSFSLTALGSQPLSRLGLSFERGSLGVFPNVGPIPSKTTTLESPPQFYGIFFASVAQPLSQQFRIGLSIQLAKVGLSSAEEEIRLKRQATVNEVRRLYYGILEAESGKKSLKVTVDSLAQLDQETVRQAVERTVLQVDALKVQARLAEAEYELLKVEDPLQTQKQQQNRLMGRDVNTLFEADPLSVANFVLPELEQACAKALEFRPEIRLARLQVSKAILERRITSSTRIPDISLSSTTLATRNLSNTLPSNLSGVGIQMSWDVFDWERKRRQVNEKRQAEQESALELTDAEAQVVIEVNHQYRRLVEARKGLEAAEKLQSEGRELLRVTTNQFAQKQLLLSDVLKVQAGLTEMDHRFTQALLAVATAQADFEKAIGEDE